MSSLGNFGPPPPTHEQISMPELTRLARALHDALAESGTQRLTPDMIDAVAESAGGDRTHAWVAAGLDPTLDVEVDGEVLIGVCVGQCQLQGAAPILERMLAERDRRKRDRQPSFEILPRRCFDMCSRAPVVLAQTKDGVAGLAGISAKEVPEAIAMVFESLEEG